MSKSLTGLAACIAILISLCPMCAESQPYSLGEENLLLDAKRASDSDDLQGIEKLETRALKYAGASAYRSDGKLILRLSSRAIKIYKDNDACKTQEHESNCVKYSLLAHVRSLGIFLVVKLHYESAEYLLVDDVSGSETSLRNIPNFSPSGEHLLVLIANDEQIGFAVQVWRRDGHQFRLEWQGSPNYAGEYIGYRLLRWRSEDTVELESYMSAGPARPEIRKRFSLQKLPNGWAVVNE